MKIMSNSFGRGSERYICECGRFFDTIQGCTWCKTRRMRTIMARKVADKRERGIPIKSWQKRAQKAYMSRLVNIGINEPERFERLIEKLITKDGNERRANQVRKRIKRRLVEISLGRLG